MPRRERDLPIEAWQRARKERTLTEIEQDLESAAVIEAQPVREVTSETPANQVFRCTLEGGLIAYFKPVEGIVDTRVPLESQPKRERAAYLVANALGFHHIPPTALRKIEGFDGVLRVGVRGTPLADKIIRGRENGISLEKSVNMNSLAAAGLFDYLIAAGDHHEGNFYVDSKGNVWSIDNALSFVVEQEYEWSAPLEELKRGLPGPKRVLDELKTFGADAQKVEKLRAELAPLLEREEVEECFRRLERVVTTCKVGSYDSQYVDLVALQPNGERVLARCTLREGEGEIRCVGSTGFVAFLAERGVPDLARLRENPRARLYLCDGLAFLRALVQYFAGFGIVAKGIKREETI